MHVNYSLPQYCTQFEDNETCLVFVSYESVRYGIINKDVSFQKRREEKKRRRRRRREKKREESCC